MPVPSDGGDRVRDLVTLFGRKCQLVSARRRASWSWSSVRIHRVYVNKDARRRRTRRPPKVRVQFHDALIGLGFMHVHAKLNFRNGRSLLYFIVLAMPDDLFSFLNDQEAPEDDDVEEDELSGDAEAAMVVDTVNGGPSHLKRKVEDVDATEPPVHANEGAEDGMGNKDADMEEEDREHTSKKPRLINAPNPVVVDEFETEAKREVAASAGLTGAVEAGTRLELRHQVRHQVAVPPSYNYTPIANHVPPAKPAREYKFILDPFQEVSVHAIQRNESVLVSAHTSAGKTVVAEYAIAQCLQNKQRVIYTSPIKVSLFVEYITFPSNTDEHTGSE